VIVWGLVLVVVGLWSICGSLGWFISPQLTLILMLATAGVTLVVTALGSALRRL
jgi:hypothetical protein